MGRVHDYTMSGEYLTRLRELGNATQHEMATMLKISQAWYCTLELGLAHPSKRVLSNLLPYIQTLVRLRDDGKKVRDYYREMVDAMTEDYKSRTSKYILTEVLKK